MFLVFGLMYLKMASFNYVSCIKIAGAPILPPLVTEKDKEILASYKAKAIQKEKELANRRNQLINSYSSGTDYEALSGNSSDLEISDNSIDTEKVMDFIRQALHDVGHSDVKLLQSKILEEMQKIRIPYRTVSCDTLHLLEDVSLSEDKVPFDQTIQSPTTSAKATLSLTSGKNNFENVDSPKDDSQFTPKTLSGSFNLDFSNEELNESPMKPSQITFEENSKNDQTPPKLIRRNSYTLESPSPSVLLYLKSLRKHRSEASCSEFSQEKKVVKNLNNYWDSSDESHGSATSDYVLSISAGDNNNLLAVENTDNHNIPEGNDNNSHVISSPVVDNVEKEAVFTIKRLESASPNITPEKEKAIVKIQAGIRGYLVRRLMKTNKVMELRDTIKDSLICALALHSEQNVSTADVNLHVRLIRQVTAACYELHAIFFEFSPQEKMYLISLDREKLLSAERAKMSLRRLKGIKSDDEDFRNSGINSLRGKLKRPSSLPLKRRGNSINKSR